MTASPRFSRRGTALAAALLAFAGCHGRGPTEPEGAARPLPAAFFVNGSADSTESDGTTVSCLLELRFELDGGPRVIPGGLEYVGTHGGAIRRSVVDAQGNGIALWPHVFGDAEARSLAPDRIELGMPGNAGAESRFYSELELLEGRFDPFGQASGTWNCAPFDIDSGGYVDELYTARGTWTLIPDP